MTTKLKEVDVVIVGLGWTGGILAKELSAAGMKVVALERGGQRSTEADFQVPQVRDELRYVVRHDLMMNTQKDTITVRNNVSQEALPMRRFGACQYCGHCQRFGCEANAKGSAHITVIPIAMRNPNFELRTNSWVTRVIKDSSGKRVTGVTYTNVLNGEEFEQPAQMVLLCAYAINNVHLMLLSGIGAPYDPVAQTGVIGRNYCYQTGAGATLFFEGRRFNPFMAGGGTNVTLDDFNVNLDFDRGPHGFVGGYNVSSAHNTGAPIEYRPLP